jgi:AcrR family transcriptional regulator
VINASRSLRGASKPEACATTDKYQEKREAILVAAAQEFNQHGIKGATLEGVASRVGLLKASVNYYYRRKEDLAADAMLRSIATLHELVATALKAPGPAEQIRSLLRGQAALLADVANGRRSELVSLNEVRALAAPQGDQVAEAYNALFRKLRAIFSASGFSAPGLSVSGSRDGLERSAHFDRFERNARTYLLLTLTTGMRVWMLRFEPEDYARVADQLSDLLIGGLARQPDRWGEPAALDWAPPASGEHATREAFLRAATTLINEQGYRGASVDRISARLNLTKGSFYHHHASKDDLVALCFEHSFDVIRRTQLLAIDRLASGGERLAATACALVRFQLSDQGPLLRATARSALADASRSLTVSHMAQLTERFGLFIVDGMIEGSIRPVDASMAAQQVATMINAASALRWWVPGMHPDSAVRLFAQPLFVGLLTPCPARGVRPACKTGESADLSSLSTGVHPS